LSIYDDYASSVSSQKKRNTKLYEQELAKHQAHPILTWLANGLRNTMPDNDRQYMAAQAGLDKGLIAAQDVYSRGMEQSAKNLGMLDMARRANAAAQGYGEQPVFSDGAGIDSEGLDRLMTMLGGAANLNRLPAALNQSAQAGFSMGGGRPQTLFDMPGGVIPDPIDMQMPPVQNTPISTPRQGPLAKPQSGKVYNVEAALGKQKHLWAPLLNAEERRQGHHNLGETAFNLLKSVYSPDYKLQLSAGGGVHTGHSNGQGGEHTDPNTFDLGLSGTNARQAKLLLRRLIAGGANVLEEGKGTSNHHYHVRAGSAGQQAQKASGMTGIQGQIVEAARKYGVDPALALALTEQESHFNQNAVSPDGALGLMQLMPSTAKELGVNPRDAAQNIDGGVRYLAKMISQGGGNKAGLAGYIGGTGGQQKYNRGVNTRDRNDNTFSYVDKISNNAKKYQELLNSGVSQAAASKIVQQVESPSIKETKDGQLETFTPQGQSLQPVDWQAVNPQGMGSDIFKAIAQSMTSATNNGLGTGVTSAHNRAVDPSAVAENYASASANNALADQRRIEDPLKQEQAQLEAEKMRMIVDYMRTHGGLTPSADGNMALSRATLGVSQQRADAQTDSVHQSAVNARLKRGDDGKKQKISILNDEIKRLQTQQAQIAKEGGKRGTPAATFKSGAISKQIEDRQNQIKQIGGLAGKGQGKKEAKSSNTGTAFVTSSGLKVSL
jgi:hypothetical protein